MLDAFGAQTNWPRCLALPPPLRRRYRRHAEDRAHLIWIECAVVPAASLPTPDWVIVPAIGCKLPAPLQGALGRSDVRDAADALRRWADNVAVIAAACTGTFVLAESSLLDDQDATTSWWLAPLFRQRYPKVRLDESRMILLSSIRDRRRRGILTWRSG